MDITVVDQQSAECISHIISLSVPRDACKSSLVCHVFKSAADSDSVGEVSVCVKRSEMDITNVLPVERISHMISLTAPRDACRLAVVSPVFKSAADSDLVWEKFLPSDHKLIIPNSVSSSSLVTSLSKKVLIFHLYHHPIFINNGTMEKETGRKCYVVGARGYLLSFIEKFVTSN
ncbi:hypothetical protein CUMW_125890 [Citrus unshiu]|nr:hypothetical protein CUMW_125890 [Citrus unshiu]